MSKPLLIDFGRMTVDRLHNINKNDIVLDDYVVEAIPVEWLKKKYGWLTMTGEIIKDWEKENGKQ